VSSLSEKPADARQSTAVSRRGFFEWALGTGIVALAGAAIYPLVRFVIPPKVPEAKASSAVAAKVGELAVNTGKIFRFGKDPALLIMTSDGKYRAFSAICTHLDCTVQYRKDFGVIWCACHNGKYDLNGRNISGPPPRPLDELRVVIQGNDILISKKA